MGSMSASSDALALEPTRPLMRSEYDRLVEAGVFDDEKIELIEGRLVLMSPEGSPHAEVITALGRLLVLALDGRARIRSGHPLAVSDISEPEPDLAAVAIADYWTGHPTTAYLAIEVAHSSLRKDRVIKPALYAGAGVPEYWIVDLNARTVTVLSEPGADGYARRAEHRTGTSITLVAFPDVAIAVDDFLPSRG